MWAELVVGSRPCSEGFSLCTPVFLPQNTQKNNISKFKFDLETVHEESLCGCANEISICF